MSDTFLGKLIDLPLSMAQLTPDPKPFLSDHFDVNAYANAVLSGKIYDPEAPSQAEGSGSGTVKIVKGREAERGDVGVELAKLNYGIEDITKQLRSEVRRQTGRHETSLTLSRSHRPTRCCLTT
jgi:hypothetical protein